MGATVRPAAGGLAAAAVLGPAVAIAAGVLDVLPAVAVASLAVPVAIAIWSRPQRGLLLLVALVPYDGLLLIAPQVSGINAWKEVLLGFTLAASFNPKWNTVPERTLPPWVVPFAALVAVAVLTTLWASPLQAVVGLKVTFFGALTAVVAWRCPFRRADVDRLVTVLAVTGVVVALVGIGQQLLGPERLHELGYAYNSVIRFTGGFMRSWSTFNQPFPFAFFLMLVLLITGSVALADPGRLRNRLILLATPVLLAGMAVAVVRAAWIGLFAGWCYLAFTRHRRLLAFAPLVGGLVIAALVLGAATFFSPPSVAARYDRWRQIPEVVISAPLGMGIGTAGAAAARAETLTGGDPTFDPSRVETTRLVFQPDNSYVKVAYELGVLGLGLFILLLVAVLVAARRAEHEPDVAGFAPGVTALVIAAAAASLAATFFEIFPLDYLFWLLVGIATCSTRGGPIRQRGDQAIATA